MIGPCEWPADPCEDNYGFTGEDAEAQAAAVEDEAIFILWSLTGQRYGLCEVVAVNPPSCWCSPDCRHRTCELRLPGPVADVVEVTIGGVVDTEWVQRGDSLLRTTPWPADVEVTYHKGLPVPAGGARAVGALALEIAKAKCGDTTCRLPFTLVQRTRQGDTVSLEPLADGKTGLPLVDMWVSAVVGVRPQGRVWSPDVDPMVVTAVASSGA